MPLLDVQEEDNVVSHNQSSAAALKKKKNIKHSSSTHTSRTRDWVESWGSAEISTCADILGVGNQNKAGKTMFFKIESGFSLIGQLKNIEGLKLLALKGCQVF